MISSASNRFISSQELVLSGFERQRAPYGGLAARLVSDAPIQAQFDRFAARVVGAVGRQYLPIYRMADGEFAFLVGWQPPRRKEPPLREVHGSLSRFWRNAVRRRFSTMWGEEYDRSERTVALKSLEASIREVAARGILGIYFMLRGDRWGEEYFEPVCSWFEEHDISLSGDNYVPFYFVYALLNGKRRRGLLSGRRVLVVTHLTRDRIGAIERGLAREGVSAVSFLPVSASKALFDVIDPSPFAGRVDVALVAAGIGSANVLVQLAPLSIPCIDAGITIECLIDPARRSGRPFLMPG